MIRSTDRLDSWINEANFHFTLGWWLQEGLV